ncbi:MAG TPA: hypothetical protein VKD91_23020 [Pyrinomonadaceae bacterium]|nr:hypothetical protein [Pyrinomonadaceae bacterium]
MKKTLIVAGLCVTGMLLFGAVSGFGQQKEPPPTLPPAAPVGPNTFSFVNSEFAFDGRTIKGSPYSGTAVTETTQVLGDGNRIVNLSTASLYRDSEGRTRREQTLKAIGGITAGAPPLQTIMISDPVAGVSYSLDPVSRTARKNPMGNFSFQTSSSAPGVFAGTSGNVVFSGSRFEASVPPPATVSNGASSNAPTAPSKAPPMTWTTQSVGVGGFQVVGSDGGAENVKKEDLGTETIEGVSATGTRVTFTIPAGQIGNERAIEIVDERWFSKDLQAVVMTRHSDPRSGETVYRLTNISRTEPDHSLFEVPADYQIKEGPTLPARVRRPEEQ